MIAFVRGRVAATTLSTAVVDVGGVGYELQCTPSTLADLRSGQEATLATALVVREDSMTLFGFADDDERDVFALLQTASGVGPKLAQAMLAVHRPDDLRRAVATEDLKALTAVPGIGTKGAQRIVLELRDRLGAPVGAGSSVRASAQSAGWRDQVHAGLTGLGWSSKDADKALDSVEPMALEQGDAPDVAALLRAALRSLSRS